MRSIARSPSRSRRRAQLGTISPSSSRRSCRLPTINGGNGTCEAQGISVTFPSVSRLAASASQAYALWANGQRDVLLNVQDALARGHDLAHRRDSDSRRKCAGVNLHDAAHAGVLRDHAWQVRPVT